MVSYTPASVTNKTSAFNNSLVLPSPYLKAVFYDNFRKYPTFYDKFLKVDTSKLASERENTIAGLGLWSNKTEGAEYSMGTYNDGTKVEYVHTTWAKAFDNTIELREDNQWKQAISSTQELARGAYATIETEAAKFMEQQLAGTGSPYGAALGANGGLLFSATQTLIGTEASPSTTSNVITNQLNAAGLNAVYTLAWRGKTDSGLMMPINLDVLMVPPELLKKAKELLESEFDPESSSNAVNVFSGRIKTIVVNPYLTSSTAWYILDSRKEACGKIFWRVRPQFNPPREDIYSDNNLYTARMRFSLGHTQFQDIFASTGTGS